MIANCDHLVRDRREAARLRLLAEGVPRRSRQADEALRRDAPLPAGHRRASRASTIVGARGQSSRRGMHGKSKYGISRTIRVVLDLLTVKFLISYSTRPLQIFGLLGVHRWACSASLVCAWLAYVQSVRHEGIGDRPLLLLGDLARLHRRAAGDARAARRDAGADVSRVAGQADLRHPRDPRNAVPGGCRGREVVAWDADSLPPSFACALSGVLIAACGAPPIGPGPITPPPPPPPNPPPVIASIT